MSATVPTSLDEVLGLLDGRRTVIAGGTDLMVGINAGRIRPEALVSVRAVPELREWYVQEHEVVMASGVTYTDALGPHLSSLLPALAQASRTVGSPPIRNAGTIGGNIVTASPAGDTLPVLTALDARLVLRSAGGSEREVGINEFITGPKQTVIQPRELLTAIRVPKAAGPQEFVKVGPRNAMVIAVASLALVVDTHRRAVGCALGSVGPVPIRATEAEEFASDVLSSGRPDVRHLKDVAREFARLTVGAARPIDDHRASARYRLKCVQVCAERAMERVLTWLTS